MSSTVLSSKGQVIIPKPVRDSRKWRAGTRLMVIETNDGVLFKPIDQAEKIDLSKGLLAIRKRLAYKGPTLTLEQMDKAVLAEAVRRAKS